MANDFSISLIKEYKYWIIYIHENQGYWGRCIIWCKRENALDLTDATPAEQKELFLILKDLYNAARKAFNPDWFNYAFLGNADRHLHCHFIPRYESPRIFMGKTFEDKLWGHNYRTDNSFTTPEKVLQAIKEELKKALG
jgi:diadenosine tetraphosphate (Ap4A) HIT family hydrolase